MLHGWIDSVVWAAPWLGEKSASIAVAALLTFHGLGAAATVRWLKWWSGREEVCGMEMRRSSYSLHIIATAMRPLIRPIAEDLERPDTC